MSPAEVSSLALPQAPRRYEAVVDRVLELVGARGLAPGMALPTERELAESMGVSRAVVRQAFGVLEERGLIHTIRGSGRYLRDAPTHDAEPSSRQSFERASLADILEARVILEVRVVELACSRRTSAEADHLQKLAAVLQTWEDNHRFHVALASATHNFALERLVRTQLDLAGELNQRQHYSVPERLERMRAEHCEIANAVVFRDEQMAAQLMQAHVAETRYYISSQPDEAPGGEL